MPTTLSAGDIAFVSYQAQDPDSFQFVLLKAVTAGTIIVFTDNGYRTTDGLYNVTEGALRWTAAADYAAGTIISGSFSVSGSTFTPSSSEWTLQSDGNPATPAANNFALSTGGDSLIAVVNWTPNASGASGTAIAALRTSGSFEDPYTTGANLSGLPAGLTVGVNAIAVGTGANSSLRYNPSATNSVEVGTVDQLRASINNAANWQISPNATTIGITTATFTVTPNYNFIYGTTHGGQTLPGTAAADYIVSGNGNDVINAGSGDDRVYARDGNDVVALGSGVDIAYGGAGSDTLDYSAATGAIYASLDSHRIYETSFTTSGATVSASALVGVSPDVVYEFENIIGSAFGDRLYGSAGDNLLAPGAGNDTVYAGAGIDTVSYAGAAGAVFVDLAARFARETALTDATGTVNAGTTAVSNDTLIDLENAVGSSYGDRLYGTGANNMLSGGDGDDILYGLVGDDVLNGGSGNDRLIGGIGADVLTGGSGADRFYITSLAEAGDSITDFDTSMDDLYFSSTAFNPASGFSTVAADASGPTFFYTQSSGSLSYSASGLIADSQLVVDLADGASLTSADIVFYV